MKGSANPYPFVTMVDTVDPTPPASGTHLLFVDTDEKLKMIDHASLVTDFTPGAGGGDVATDTIWDAAGDLAVGTGANTAGRLAAGAAGGVLAMGNSAVIWNAGTSFPGSKATGDRYWRTDLGLEFYWDGTRWVGSVLRREPMSTEPVLPVTATSVPLRWTDWAGGTYDLWIVALQYMTYHATLDAGKYWTIQAIKGTAAESEANVGSSFNTAGDTVSNWTSHVVAVDALLGATYRYIRTVATKTSTPGDLYVHGSVLFRVVAT